jgi:hypothetical protein
VTAESRFGAEPRKNGGVESEAAPCSAKPPAIGAGGADVDAPAEPRTPPMRVCSQAARLRFQAVEAMR